MSKPLRLAYTFGNHMHWVDMEWLWGYGVLPGSARDMLHLCREAGVKGCLNFDGIGLEKMAAEDPEGLALLREAAKEGIIEPVGGSYGQPYGLFHGGESNIRQRVHGVRTILRLLGVRPLTFWEEEFDFHPQLPQMLRGCGFTGASLYFQWTWHTPEIPFREEWSVSWDGLDGSSLPAATRCRLNLHQWPEDFQILLNDLATSPPEESDGLPLILQWLELMPSPDWMCRSELMLPMIQKLQEDPRFEIVPLTLGEWLSQAEPKAQWKPAPSDTWHGMTLGKNGDRHLRRSAELESRLLSAESASAILSLFGRPYEPWDVYPTWELEEAWRQLLAAQHHDNHECEKLCGHVAEAQMAYVEQSLNFGSPVMRLARRVGLAEGEALVFNRLGWEESCPRPSAAPLSAPPLGWRVCGSQLAKPSASWVMEGAKAFFEAGDFRAVVDLATGGLERLEAPGGTLDWTEAPSPQFSWTLDGIETRPRPEVRVFINGPEMELMLEGGKWVSLVWTARPDRGGMDLEARIRAPRLPDPGLAGAIKASWPLAVEPLVDGPFSIEKSGPGSRGRRKYPMGDWMTSPQWFEDIEGAVVSHSFLAFPDCLIAHSGSQQWLRRPGGVQCVVLANDPWDQGQGGTECRAQFFIRPGSCERPWEEAARLRGTPSESGAWPLILASGPILPAEGPPLPREFSAVQVSPPTVTVEAFYREEAKFAGKGLPSYAFSKGADASVPPNGGEADSSFAGDASLQTGHPFILRLLERSGQATMAEVIVPGPLARVVKTNLLGEALQEGTQADPLPEALTWQEADPALLCPTPGILAPFGITAAKITLNLRPHEIATLMLDIIPGRKQIRDLDAKREVWATIHRTEKG